MKLATTLRNSLGLSQHQLSAFIGGSRSILSRSEKGLRNLTPDAALNLLALFETFNATPLPDEPENDLTALHESWQAYAAVCMEKARRLQQKLNDASDGYQKAARLQNCLAKLKDEKAGQLNARQLRWIEEQSYQAGKRMTAMDYSCRRQMALQIAALESEATIYENAITTA